IFFERAAKGPPAVPAGGSGRFANESGSARTSGQGIATMLLFLGRWPGLGRRVSQTQYCCGFGADAGRIEFAGMVLFHPSTGSRILITCLTAKDVLVTFYFCQAITQAVVGHGQEEPGRSLVVISQLGNCLLEG